MAIKEVGSEARSESQRTHHGVVPMKALGSSSTTPKLFPRIVMSLPPITGAVFGVTAWTVHA
jgi:hypothetical protein